MSCFAGMLLRYFLDDFEMVAFAPVVTGTSAVFTFHMRRVSIYFTLDFKPFRTLLLLLLLLPSLSGSGRRMHQILLQNNNITIPKLQCRAAAHKPPVITSHKQEQVHTGQYIRRHTK
jgi:hypothetical protein